MPPCPDFSVGGKNRGKEGENGILSATYVELICQQRPDFFLFENVKGLLRTKKHRQFFEELKRKLRENDYYIAERLINSIEYGVPQDRERIIMIGFRGDFVGAMGILTPAAFEDGFPWEEHIVYPREKVFAYPWPRTDIFEEDSCRPEPQVMPIAITVEHWFQRNDVITTPMRCSSLGRRAHWTVSKRLRKEMSLGSRSSGFTDGVILLPLAMAIMRFIYIRIKRED